MSTRLIFLFIWIVSNFGAWAQVFSEVSSSIGIDHIHTHQYLIGGGLAVLDYDQDGWPDVYMTGGEASDKLYRNLGNGLFQDVSLSSALPSMGSNGVAAGDLDNDGFPDLVIATYRGESDRVLRNNHDGTFTDMFNALGPTNDWGSSVTLGDINKDGLLDIYVACYVETSAFITDSSGTVTGFAHEGYSNRLYLNQGNWQFEEDGAWYSVADQGCALATAFTDFDNDLDMDIFLANDFGEWVVPNGLFQNEYPWTYFTNVAYDMNSSAGIYGMGIAIGDYDHDLDLDYYVTNMGDNLLHRNDSGFTYQAEYAGVENDSIGNFMTTSWGTVFLDFDNDMWQDLFVANGNVTTGQFLQTVFDDPDKMFKNNGDGTFTDATNATGFGGITKSRGAVYADFDKDGDLDLFISTINIDSTVTDRNLVYRNNQSTGNHYLQVKPIGVLSNRDAVGTHARIVVGGESWITELNCGSSYASSNQKILHFGLGSNTVVDSLILIFPSGIEQTLVQVAGDQTIEIFEDITIGFDTRDVEVDAFISYGRYGEVYYNGSGNSQLAILDSRGRVLNSISTTGGLNQQAEIDLNQNLASGFYFVNIRTADASAVLQFIIQ